MADNGQVGGRLAARVASVVNQASVDARRKMLAPTRQLIMQAQEDFFRLMGGEIRRTLGPLFVAVADSPDAPDWAKNTFGFLGRGHGQWQAFLANTAGGAAVSSGLIPLLNNELAPVTQNLIAQNPNFVIDVGSAAALVARNLAPAGEMDTEARRQGLSSGRFRRLVRLAEHGLAPGEVLDARNRGVIGDGEARGYLRDAGYTDASLSDVLALRHALIGPEAAAQLQNFGAINQAEGRRYAAAAGMSADDYDNLAFGAGQPPPLDVLYRAARTGAIDRGRFRRGIEQGPIRVEWFDVIDKLLFVPATPEMALSAATQNLLRPAEAKAIWTEYGFRADDFEWALESNGRPLGIEQAAELYNRGKINRREARQMFLESTLKNKYVDLVFPLFERLPTLETIGRLVREGIKTKAQGIDALRDLGFTPATARDLIELYGAERAGAARDLAVGTVQELYEAGAISEADATAALVELGYDPDEVALILAVRSLRRTRRRQQLAVSRVRARYVAHRITAAEAAAALDALRVAPAEREELLDTWDVERDVTTPTLTTAQVQASLRRGFIGPEDAARRLAEAGYDETDTTLLVRLATPAGVGG